MRKDFNNGEDLPSLFEKLTAETATADPLLAIKTLLKVYVSIGNIFNEYPRIANKIYDLEEAIPAIEDLLATLNTDEIIELSETVKIPQIQGFNKLRDTLNRFLEASRKRVKISKPKNVNLISNKVFQHIPQISKFLCHSKITEASVNVGKKETEEIIVTLTLSDEEGCTLSKPISLFDTIVFCAACTIYRQGNNILSDKDILELITGNKRPEKSPALLQAIEDSLDKLRTTRITMDLTEQSKRQTKYDIKKAVLDGYMLPLEKAQVLFKGKQKFETAYKMVKIPIILEYSQWITQFVTIPKELLKLEKATPELICLHMVVLKRVLCICYGNMKYDRLAIETLLNEAGIETQYKTQKQRYIKAIKQTLELLKDKNFLEDFTAITKKSEGQKGRPTLQSFQLIPIFKKLNSQP